MIGFRQARQIELGTFRQVGIACRKQDRQPRPHFPGPRGEFDPGHPRHHVIGHHQVDRLRSAARSGSSPEWKKDDPGLPKSVWYLTNAPWVGFRIVRPVAIPSAEEMYRYWNNGVALDR